jgi:putative hemolysin
LEPYSKRSRSTSTRRRTRARVRAAAAAILRTAPQGTVAPEGDRRTPHRPRRSRLLITMFLAGMALCAFWTLAIAQETGTPPTPAASATPSPTGTPSPTPSPTPTPRPTPEAKVAKTEDQPDTLGEVIGAGWSLLLVLVLTLANAAFSMAETALVSLRASRVAQLVEEKQRGALAVQTLTQNPPRFIATVQIGITLLGFASAAAAATTLAAPLVPALSAIPRVSAGTATALAVGIVTLLVAMLSMVLGEIAPKSLALQAPDRWALRLAPFINLCAVIFTPITAVVVGLSNVLVRPFGAKAQFDTPMITREEFEKMIDQGEKHGEIDDAEAKIITNVFDMSETMVRSVMTPRIDMTALSVTASLSQTLEAIISSGHSRIPVYENTIDNVVGVVHAKDLLPLFKAEQHDVELRRVMRSPFFVPETRRISDLLAEMRRSNQHLAIVQDEYAGTEGIVSIEDLLEEIVGDIRDEYDVDEPEVQVLSESESLIDGRMSIDDVNDRLGTSLPHEDYDTLGGLVFGVLGHEPVPGERIRQDGLIFTVEQIEGRRIRLIRATKIGSEEPEPAAVEAEE